MSTQATSSALDSTLDPQRSTGDVARGWSSRRVALTVLILCGSVTCGWAEDAASTRGGPERAAGDQAQEGAPPADGVARVNTPVLTVKECIAEEHALVEQFHKEYPDDDEAWLFEAQMHRGQGRSAEAARCWEQALRVNPGRPDTYRELGQLAKDKGQFRLAIDYWRKALAVRPDWLLVQIQIADARLELGEGREALAELRQAVRGEPQVAPWHYLFGQAHLQQQELEQAKACYEQAIALDPRHTSSYYSLFTVCQRLGLAEQAREYMSVFRKLKAESTQAIRADAAETVQQRMTARLAHTYVIAGNLYQAKGNVVRAEEAFKRAVAVQPEDGAAREQLAVLYQRTGKFAAALRECEEITRLVPDAPFPYLMAGLIHSALGRLEPAESAFQKAIELAPTKDSGYIHLARLYLAAGVKLPEAQAAAGTAARLNGSAQNYFFWGWACHRNGDREPALRALAKAVELAPGNPDFRQALAKVRNKQ